MKKESRSDTIGILRNAGTPRVKESTKELEKGNKQFKYFKIPINRASTDDDDEPERKWTRTPSVNSPLHFYTIGAAGDWYSGSASDIYGVAAGFWIRKSTVKGEGK